MFACLILGLSCKTQVSTTEKAYRVTSSSESKNKVSGSYSHSSHKQHVFYEPPPKVIEQGNPKHQTRNKKEKNTSRSMNSADEQKNIIEEAVPILDQEEIVVDGENELLPEIDSQLADEQDALLQAKIDYENAINRSNQQWFVFQTDLGNFDQLEPSSKTASYRENYQVKEDAQCTGTRANKTFNDCDVFSIQYTEISDQKAYINRWDKRNFPIKIALHEQAPDWVMTETKKVTDRYNELFLELNIIEEGEQVFEFLPNKTSEFTYGDGIISVAFMTSSDVTEDDALGITWIKSNPSTGEIGDADILMQLDPIMNHYYDNLNVPITIVYQFAFGHELAHALGFGHNNIIFKDSQEDYRTLMIGRTVSDLLPIDQWFSDEYPFDYDRMLIRYTYDDAFVFEEHAFHPGGEAKYKLIRK
ncbi:hypothetical protein MRY82_08930 [bacterium]|nr:hypothetical protein [bacterium]